jgi:hypothetical protein
MGRKVKRLKNYTVEQVETLFESEENNIVGANKVRSSSICSWLQHTQT